MGASAGAIPEIPSYEVEYDEQMPDDIRAAVNVRNEGWELFKASGGLEGDEQLILSATTLSLFVPDWGDLFCGKPEHGLGNVRYTRELFATLSRLSVASAINGEWEYALGHANGAWDLALPNPDPEGEPFGGLPDQYQVTFSGQLALVLACGSRKDGATARQLSTTARHLYLRSENPAEVVFPDREMTQAERDASVEKHGKIAEASRWVANVPAPTFAKRRAVQWALARSLGGE